MRTIDEDMNLPTSNSQSIIIPDQIVQRDDGWFEIIGLHDDPPAGPMPQ